GAYARPSVTIEGPRPQSHQTPNMSPPQPDRPPSIGLRRSLGVLAILGRHLWPKNEWGLRSRVSVALVLLVMAKVANVYVPILYKHAVDALAHGKAPAGAGP